MPDSTSAPPRYSLVIPAYNEARWLPRLLDSVEEARRRYPRGAEAIEVIVADNASGDATAEIARGRGCRVVRVEKRAIAAARNGGAAVARGEILAFVDADSQIHPETFNAIDRSLATGKVVAGATGVRLERTSPGIIAAYALVLSLVWLAGLDSGVVFCRREDFEAVGGYNEARLFAEDMQFLLDLKRLGRKRGQKLARVRSAKALTSTRKFDDYGDWHYVLMVLRLPFYLLFAKRALTAFARRYWYEQRR